MASEEITTNNQTKTMLKKLLLLTAVSCVFAVQTTTAFADMSSAQRQIIDAQKIVREVLKTEEGCKAMCDEILANKKAKKMLCEAMKKDPAAVKMITEK